MKWFGLFRRNNDEDGDEEELPRALSEEETEDFFSEYRQSEAYQIYRSIKDGTYRQEREE